jgi:hypothetical protein
MRIPVSAVALGVLVCLGGCATVDLPQPPRPGAIAAPAGGADGYQHGFEGSRFVVGDAARRSVQYGYLKQRGDSGTIAIKMSNGSAFGVPNAGREYASSSSSRYAGSPDDHNAQVKGYFLTLGLPASQVADVRAMTLLQADGQIGETSPAAPYDGARTTLPRRSDFSEADGQRINLMGSCGEERRPRAACPAVRDRLVGSNETELGELRE